MGSIPVPPPRLVLGNQRARIAVGTLRVTEPQPPISHCLGIRWTSRRGSECIPPDPDLTEMGPWGSDCGV